MSDKGFDFVRAQIRAHVKELTGTEAYAAGVELAALIRAISHLYEALSARVMGTDELSDARIGLLARLLAEARRGNTQGLSPTYLSHCMHVSKNTVSALIRGLETQGLVERVLDETDRRRFFIRLTPEGERLVSAMAPRHLAALQAPLEALTPEEQATLLALLDKLGRALKTQLEQREDTPVDPVDTV